MEKPAPKKYHSPEEYLALEEKAAYKSDYYKGKIFAMSEGTISHIRIVRNLTTEMAVALKTNTCEVFMNDMHIWVAAKDLFTYPDVIVVCNDVQFYHDRNDHDCQSIGYC